MKYMKYELLVRSQSQDDDVADQALAEWERAGKEYGKHIKKIRPKLPKPVQALLDDFDLHDAKAITAGRAEDVDNSFFLLLQLNEPRGHGLRLDYTVVAPPKLHFNAPQARLDTEAVWLYDEIDVSEVALPDNGKISVFEHNILFTHGVEMRLRFSNLALRKYEKVFSSLTQAFHSREAGKERELLLS